MIAQIIKLRANNSEHGIKSIGMDNAAEFSVEAFSDYFLALVNNYRAFRIVCTHKMDL
jgi:hypothetical protein